MAPRKLRADSQGCLVDEWLLCSTNGLNAIVSVTPEVFLKVKEILETHALVSSGRAPLLPGPLSLRGYKVRATYESCPGIPSIGAEIPRWDNLWSVNPDTRTSL